ncbi:class II SORL domain-containing protein [Candidatus Latescibacterota bacterium]
MKRRKALIISAGVAGISGLNVSNVFAADSKRFGDTIIPPSKESGKEKHVPIIDAPASVKAGEPFSVTVEVGKTVPHPNTVEHHIAMIQLYVLDEDSMFTVNVGTFNLGPTVAAPKISIPVMIQKNSTLYALGYCNLHGVWDYSVEVKVS